MRTFRNVLIILVILLFCTAVFAEKVGVLKSYKGKVMVKTSAKAKWIKAKWNMKIEKNYIIKTAKGAKANIRLKNGSYTISQNKTVKMTDILAKTKKSKKSFSLAKLNLLRRKLGRGASGSANTPTAVAGVRGADVSEISKYPIRPSELIWED